MVISTMFIGGTEFSVNSVGMFCMVVCLIIVFTVFAVLWKDQRSIYSRDEISGVSRVAAAFLKNREVVMQEKRDKASVLKLAEMFQHVKIFPFSADKKLEYEELIYKLDVCTKKDGFFYGIFNTYKGEKGTKKGRPMLPEDYYVEACFLQSELIVVAVLLGVIFNPAMFLLIMGVPLVPEFIRKSLKKATKREILQINEQFPTFVSMFYYRFRNEDTTLNMESLIDDFLPIANKAMLKLLVKFRTDLQGLGDVLALNQLTFRYLESDYVSRFTSVAEGIYRKQSNAYIMLNNLYLELQKIREANYRKQDMERADKVQKAQMVIWAEFAVVALVAIGVGIAG